MSAVGSPGSNQGIVDLCQSYSLFFFKKGFVERTILFYDNFIALWISFNAFYNVYRIIKIMKRKEKEVESNAEPDNSPTIYSMDCSACGTSHMGS